MIEITKLNGAKTSGKKIIVKESRQEVKNLVKLARKEIFASDKEEN